MFPYHNLADTEVPLTKVIIASTLKKFRLFTFYFSKHYSGKRN